MFKAFINKNQYTVEKKGDKIIIGDTEFEFDIRKINDRTFSVIQNNISYNIFLVAIDNNKKVVTLRINGKDHQVKLQSKTEALLDKLGLKSSLDNPIKCLDAPMPGLVLSVEVMVGYKVKKGDILIVLEAMKMENNLKAKGNGVVKEVFFSKGASVEKGETLIIFE